MVGVYPVDHGGGALKWEQSVSKLPLYGLPSLVAGTMDTHR